MPKQARFVIGIMLVVAAIGYLIASAVSNTAEYYLTLKFAISEPPAEGESPVTPVAAGSLGTAVFNVLSRGQPKPDMFAAGRDVIVEGQLDGDNMIEARQVLTSCPSKYVPKSKPE